MYLLVWSRLLVPNRNRNFILINCGRSKLRYFACGDDFSYHYNAVFYEQCLICIFSIYAIHTAHFHFIIVTHTLRIKFGERSFSYAGPSAWNNLPQHFREITDTTRFKRHLKTVLFHMAFLDFWAFLDLDLYILLWFYSFVKCWSFYVSDLLWTMNYELFECKNTLSCALVIRDCYSYDFCVQMN